MDILLAQAAAIGDGAIMNLIKQYWPFIAIGIVMFMMFKKSPSPAPKSSGDKPEGDSINPKAHPLTLAQFEQAAMQLHAAVSNASSASNSQGMQGFGAFDPSSLVTLLNAVIQFWPIIVVIAKLFGINLPTLPVNPLPVPTPQLNAALLAAQARTNQSAS